MSGTASLLEGGPVVVSVGVRDLAEALAAQDVPVVQLEWTPPPELDDETAALLEALG